MWAASSGGTLTYTAAPAARISTAGQANRSYPGRIGRGVFFDIVPDIPDGAVVDRIHGGLRVVLPAHQRLRRLALDEHGLSKRQRAARIARQARGQPLAGIIRRTAKRVSDRDVAAPIDRGARHPAIEAVGGIRALLVQAHLPIVLDPEFVPAHAAAPRRRVDGMYGDDRFASV